MLKLQPMHLTGQLLSANLNSVTAITADADVNVTGQLLSANLDSVRSLQMLMSM
jgi:hypothetical protein